MNNLERRFEEQNAVLTLLVMVVGCLALLIAIAMAVKICSQCCKRCRKSKKTGGKGGVNAMEKGGSHYGVVKYGKKTGTVNGIYEDPDELEEQLQHGNLGLVGTSGSGSNGKAMMATTEHYGP